MDTAGTIVKALAFAEGDVPPIELSAAERLALARINGNNTEAHEYAPNRAERRGGLAAYRASPAGHAERAERRQAESVYGRAVRRHAGMQKPPRTGLLARMVYRLFQAGHLPTVRERRAKRNLERALAAERLRMAERQAERVRQEALRALLMGGVM